MDTHFELNDVLFRWDNAKAVTNIHKHGVSFEQAAQVFFDPFLKMRDASRNDEARDAVLGSDEQGRLLYVVHIEFDDDQSIRLISARKATTQERHYYEYD